MANTFPCPNCGASVTFQSRVSVVSVCTYCHSLLMRNDLTVENLGQIAVLQDDPSPLLIGSAGQYERRAFTLIGRVQMVWDRGRWNEWHMYFDGEESGWLAEAQGQYMVSFHRAHAAGDLPPAASLSPGMSLSIAGVSYEVFDIKPCTLGATEGEIPFRAVPGRASVCVDLAQGGQFASLDYGPDETRVYLGRYVEFDSLKLTGLKQFDGW